MRVWIEQDYCTGDGLCAELCPDVFAIDETERVAYVRPEAAAPLAEGSAERVGTRVAPDLEDGVLDAQAQCGGSASS